MLTQIRYLVDPAIFSILTTYSIIHICAINTGVLRGGHSNILTNQYVEADTTVNSKQINIDFIDIGQDDARSLFEIWKRWVRGACVCV